MPDKKSGGKSADLEQDLRQEVAALASQLGLAASTGESAGFDDTDFRPKSRPAADSKDAAANLTTQPSAREAKPQAVNAGPTAKGRPDQRPRDREAEAPKKGPVRVWKTSVGPRPGEKQGKSLLGADEPSLWHEAAAALPPVDSAAQQSLSVDEVEERRLAAEEAMAGEAASFEKAFGRRNGQDMKWLQEVRRMGTTADKVAAMTLLLQESAVSNLRSLDELLRWVSKRSGARAVAGQAIDALREIFTVALLPDRKLVSFEDQPLSAVPSGKDGLRCLLYYHFEDQLKKRYAAFIGMLEEASRDNLEFLKEKALKAIAQLLLAKPEQEARLLSALVNKLGDPSRKLASKAGYLLREVLETHPAMKVVITREVEKFLFRPGLQERARYYGVIFLNQMPLSHNAAQGGGALAEKLVETYFTLFKLILEGKLGHAQQQAAAKEEKGSVPSKKGAKPGGKGAKSKGSLPNGKAQRPPSSIEQAAEVDARMLGALLTGVRRAFPFVESSKAEDVATQHADALFRILHTAPFGVAVQALALLFQLLSARSAVSDRFYRALYSVLAVADVGHTNKAAMFLSLLFKAMQADVSNARVCAFVKRLLQVALHQQPNFACGCLMITSQLLQEKPALWAQILEANEADENEVEHFKDAPALDEEPLEAPAMSDEAAAKDSDSAKQTGAAEPAKDAGGPHRLLEGYDMAKREPLHAGADKVPWWELVPLASHVHSSVAAMARQLLAGAPIVYNGDPLRDLSLRNFLDTFVQRKPKAHAKGSSLMQPLRPQAAQPSLGALGSAAFQALAAADVAPEADFFQKYQALREKRAAEQPGKKKRKRADEDEGASTADEMSDSDDAVDTFLDAEESEEEDADRGTYDYKDLAAAFNQGGFDGLSGSDVSDEDSMPEDDDANDEEDRDGPFKPSANGKQKRQKEPVELDSDDLNVLELPDASGSDVTGSGDDSDSSEGSWVMHEPDPSAKEAASALPNGQKHKRKLKQADEPDSRGASKKAELKSKAEAKAGKIDSSSTAEESKPKKKAAKKSKDMREGSKEPTASPDSQKKSKKKVKNLGEASGKPMAASEPMKQPKKSKKAQAANQDIFAAVEDFEDMLQDDAPLQPVKRKGRKGESASKQKTDSKNPELAGSDEEYEWG